MTWNELDGEHYVRVYKNDAIFARMEHEPDWAKSIRERSATK